MERFRSLPDLNFDILLQIMSLSTAQDVESLTRTCRGLRVALAAELPRGEVTLEGRCLASFLAFASVKDGRDRLTYLHKLVLPGSTYGESMSNAGKHAMSIKDVKGALPDLFKLASHSIQSLTILDLDVFSFRPPELKAMLDSLPRLRELEMSRVEKRYQNTLTDTLPHLHALTLGFCSNDTDTDPFLRAPHRAPNLQTLTLYNGILPVTEDAALSFPAVHTLRVCPRQLPCDVDACMRLFPNVRHATLDFPEGYGALAPAFRKDMRPGRPLRAWSNPSAVQARRARFLARVQEARGTGAWPHLQSVRAAGYDAWNIDRAGLVPQKGLARLEVACGQWTWQGETRGQRMFVSVLNELRPRCVVFHPSTFDSADGLKRLRFSPFARSNRSKVREKMAAPLDPINWNDARTAVCDRTRHLV
ncbi:hypothetical protein GSI_09638 [Ganoderma sinense ZZ0214-1]|uniref:F-box domain-containing protein n=1 Tax=Ganoderma sinense ZZ0214-1 TaxID=1077348 RepID=A0A2G8S379_9APHY|nr:hypothetical protein GSI_09638 [Ganoderma sinense ZZ0214-1]